MCGIAALFSVTGESLHPCALRSMLDLIRHRGPDDEGWTAFLDDMSSVTIGGGPDTPVACHGAALPYTPPTGVTMPVDAQVAIGHRRLAIVDVSPAGHQPMCYASGRYWIVFNGEIYNHTELREELSRLGCSFVSHSDTEVILAAYATWGEACLERLEGMFAFVLVDRAGKTALVARDRFGIKPLYYWRSPGGVLAFASEIKQFTVLPGWQARLNGQRTYDFLAWGILDHTDETLFEGVFQIPPGACSVLCLDDPSEIAAANRIPTKQWYCLAGTPFSGSFDAAADRFREMFRQAVGSHLRADVPVGSCLSGGLDSSAIVCMAHRILRDQGVDQTQYAFSAGSKYPRFDERSYVAEVVQTTGVEVRYVLPDLPSLLARIDQLAWHQDEPFGSTSIFAQWLVFEMAAKNRVKVLLDGQGADEQLAGYRGYFGAHFTFLFTHLRWLELFAEIRGMSRTQGSGVSWAVKYIADAMLPEWIRNRLRAMIGKETAEPAWLDLARLGAIPRDPVRGEHGALRSINELSYRQLTGSNLQMLLHWEDRNSMAHSVEARVPFLDRRLVEFVLGVPEAYKLSRGITKRILRAGLRGILPDVIADRMSKLGFATPEELWVRQEAPETFRRAIADAVESSHGILTQDALSIVDDVIRGKRKFDFLVWRMISFSAWMNRFDVTLDQPGVPE